MVLKNNDSTAHGEISAIRDAEQALGTYDLAGGRDAMKDFLTCIDRDACLELFRVYNSLEHSIY